jgi:TolB-like protein
MDTIGLSGNDAPGLFGSGLIEQIGLLQNKAVKQLVDSVAAFYADRVVPAGKGRVTASFKPKKASEIPFLEPGRTYTVAVMPFYNRSKRSRAGEILALRFVSQLVKNKAFQVIEPGVVRQKLLNFRTIMHEGPSKEDAKSFFMNVGTDLLLMGRIIEYQEGSPKMDFEVQVFEGKSRSMVWSSWSYNQGNDAVIVFDWRRVNNAGELASKMAKAVVLDMIAE